MFDRSEMDNNKGISEKKFWEIVKKINWKKLCAEHRDPVKFGKKIVRTQLDLSVDEITACSEMCMKLYNKLKSIAELECMRRCGNKDVNNIKPDTRRLKDVSVSDDGFYDMLNHIIGLGQERYEAACKNVDEMWVPNYKECFAYVFH